MKHTDIYELCDTSNTISLVYHALAEETFTPEEDVRKEGGTKFTLDADYYAAFRVLNLEKHVRRIVTTTEPGFDIGLRFGRRCILKIHPLGCHYKTFQNVHRSEDIPSFLNTKLLNPYLDLLLNIWPEISDLSWQHFRQGEVMPNGLFGAENFNESLNDLRNYVLRLEFKKRCDLWFKQSGYIFRSTRGYIDHLFSKYARLLVIRMDFGFRVASDLRSDLQGCRDHFKRLIINQNHNSLFDNQVGYIWRLEFAVKKGWHYHCAFFFDGSKSRKDITIGNAIGDYWMKVITNGQGTYWNCNRHKEQYELFKTLGVGMVNYDDEVMREKLLNVVTYLCKIDLYLRQALPDDMQGVRTFGRGQITNEVVKQGRPRQTLSDAAQE